MKTFCVHLDPNCVIDYQFINDLLEHYDYNVDIHIVHEERNISKSLLFYHFGYLSGDCVFFHYIKTPYNLDNVISNIYSNTSFDATFYIKCPLDHNLSRDWFDVYIANMFTICKSISETQKERKLYMMVSNDINLTALQFAANLCDSLKIQHCQVINNCELIFNKDNVSEFMEFGDLCCENSICKVVESFKVSVDPYVKSESICFSTMHELSKCLIQTYVTNQKGNIEFDGAERRTLSSLKYNIVPTIIHCLKEYDIECKVIQYNDDNTLPNDHWIMKYIRDYIQFKFNKI
jgi:hypothetical protein